MLPNFRYVRPSAYRAADLAGDAGRAGPSLVLRSPARNFSRTRASSPPRPSLSHMEWTSTQACETITETVII